ncbi:hypothetical protein [Noviherbaspirillum saxi]|uniref:SpoIIAA-like n=1 Tax=Noviherbaspirillum saxi TaxID=2320863 RepID=A0A3A3FSK7_9BURK|nr:hypothetical protein [Noviherbaspirillum saxi]RJF99197.1 hypothetical protein D3871_12215 [Noviherbaspirillum saxi]
MEQQKLWVEPVGSIIMARLRGACTAEMLKECQERVLALAKDTQHVKVLYDSLELDAPDIDLVLLQQRLEAEKKVSLGSVPLRTAILVPNTRIAFLARIAFGQFGEGQYRVFYNDMVQAIRWLEE